MVWWILSRYVETSVWQFFSHYLLDLTIAPVKKNLLIPGEKVSLLYFNYSFTTFFNQQEYRGYTCIQGRTGSEVRLLWHSYWDTGQGYCYIVGTVSLRFWFKSCCQVSNMCNIAGLEMPFCYLDFDGMRVYEVLVIYKQVFWTDLWW